MPNETLTSAAAVETIYEYGAAQAKPFEVEGAQFALVPKSFNLSPLAPHLAPKYITQHLNLLTAQSFIDYVIAQPAIEGNRRAIFVNYNAQECRFMAVLDYHGTKPGRCVHEAVFAAPKTEEWGRWLVIDRKDQTQGQLAEFLEENMAMFKTPGGADMLELVNNLEGRVEMDAASAQKLNSGAFRVLFEENVTLRGGTGTAQIDFPTLAVLQIPVYLGEPPFEFEARLKYRISSRKITFRFETIRLQAIIRQASEAIIQRIADGTNLPIYRGVIG